MDKPDYSEIQKLNCEESFSMWKFQLNIVLKSQNLLSVLLDKGDQKRDEQRDAQVQKTIMYTINKKYIPLLMNCVTAKEMYEKLCKIFENSSEQQKCDLMQELFQYTYNHTKDMTHHISTIENIAFRLKNIDEKVTDGMLISKILSTLPDNYKTFITAWDSTPLNEKTLSNLTTRLLTEEKRSNTDKQAFFNKHQQLSSVNYKKNNKNTSKYKEKFCKICNKRNHEEKDCYFKKKECKICKKQNHEEKDCYFRHTNKMALLTMEETTTNSQFIVDSGCTTHLTRTENILKNEKSINTKIHTAKKNEQLISEKAGKIETKDFYIDNVLYVPNLEENLLSVNALTEKDAEVIFTKKNVIIKKNNTEILKGKKNTNGLYTVELDCNQGDDETSYMSFKKNSAVEWHRKLGHPGKEKMKKMINIVNGMKISNEEIDNMPECEICIQSKQTRFPFSTQRYKASNPLEIICTDICGPITPSTWDNKRYILTCIDEYTNYTKVYLLTNKSEAFGNLKNYIIEAERQQNLKVKIIRCDCGGEYKSNAMRDYCKENGIIIDYTTPYSPQLNGKAERYNRTLMEKVRAMMYESNVDGELWGEAAKTACYILNRIPVERDQVTPTEKWTNRKPTLKYLQVFGSEAYSKNLEYLHKLDKRSKKYILVGFTPTGYKLWDKEQRKIIVRRDVVFLNKIPNEENSKDEKESIKIIIENQNYLPIQVHTEDINQEEEEKDSESVKCLDQNEDTEYESTEEYTDTGKSPNKEGKRKQVSSSDEREEQQDEDSKNQKEDKNENQKKEESNLNNGQESNLNNEPRKSHRTRKQPEKLNDYFTYLTYSEATTGPEKEEWIKAINSEKQSLKENNVWELVDRAEAGNRKVLTNKWVLKQKNDGKYKARLVARGCEQKPGIDYEETFSPVINNSSIRAMLAIAANKHYHIIKLDIKTAFLYGDITEDLYMHVPEGYEKQEGKICKLRKSLYGLKQSPLKWNQKFSSALKSKGLFPLETEPCIFKTEKGDIILGIYVDDGFLIGENEIQLRCLLKKLEKDFKMTYTEAPNTFLGMEIIRTETEIRLGQEEYATNILEKFNMENSKPCPTPLVKTQEEKVKINTEDVGFPYREAIGSLLYLSNKTRPDLAFSVNFESRNMEQFTDVDVKNVKRTFRYLNGSKNMNISYKVQSDLTVLNAYSDSDFAGDAETRRSTTGYIIMYCGGPLQWCARKQPIVALSSCEAEYIAAAECCKELLYLKSLLEELIQTKVTVNLNVDNQSAIKLIENGVVNRRSKHIDVRYKFIHENVVKGTLQIKYVPTSINCADLLTKPLEPIKFKTLCEQIYNIN